MKRLLVDGVFFQIANSGIARVWRSVLEALVARGQFEIFFLDRGEAPQIGGITFIPFPAYLSSDSAAESMLIQKICDAYKIDVFTSTYYTTPISTPMVLMIYDMIPELFDFDMNLRGWMEKETAISYAQKYLAISYCTRDDLLAFYPEIPEQDVVVAHCGVDTATFRSRSAGEIAAFKDRMELRRPYFLFVGSRVQHNAYKNSQLFFSALRRIRDADFDVFCVGGERKIEADVLRGLPPGVTCRRVELSDDDLSLAYAGALALVYPSLYEGFGMPVIEAMAAGCPVITTNNGSLAEAAGDAACLVSGLSVDEMISAMSRIQDSAYRDQLRILGYAHAAKFRWDGMVTALTTLLEKVIEEGSRGTYDEFLAEWRRLRTIQASVDFQP